MGYFTDTDFDSTEDMLVSINEVLERHVRKLERVSADALGLDDRCGSVWIDRDEQIIVADKSSRSLDYYGGFEYIKDETERSECGDYVFYRNCDRVNDCFETLLEKKGKDVE